MNIQPKEKFSVAGFTLVEVMATVVIVGTLSTLALPSYLKQINRTRQNEAMATIAQIQTTISAYSDEFVELPETWKDLNDISAIMTKDGSADEENFNTVTTPNGYYEIHIENEKNEFKVVARHTENEELYAVGCLNLTNGASSIVKGPIFKKKSQDGGTEEKQEPKKAELVEANDISCSTAETGGDTEENSDSSEVG